MIVVPAKASWLEAEYNLTGVTRINLLSELMSY